MRLNTGICVGAVWLSVLAGGDVMGQDADVVAEAPTWHLTLGGWGRFATTADLDGAGDGEFNVLRAGGKVGLSRVVFDDAQLSFDFRTQFNHFDFSGANTLIAGTNDPFTDVYQYSLGGMFFDRIDDQWAWGLGVRGEFFGEKDASFSDASTVMGTALARYQFSEDLAVGLGLAVRSQIEDDALFLPVVTVDWQIDESWKLTVGESEGASHAQAVLSYDLGGDASVGLGVAYVNDRFRLDNDAIRKGSVVEDSRLPIFVNFTFQPTARAMVVIEGGVIAGQEFKVENQFGDNGRSFDSDTSGFIGASLSWKF